jgi:catechol 2,3-dioxygenase-like lactoylglutathione lyase family enzyme
VELGAFSVSLAVEDMGASREFYEKLGFTMMAGDGTSWTIMANGTTAIGLFQGMFEGNILTFNPGWTGLGEPVDEFTDVRELRAQLATLGLDVSGDTTADTPSGPASLTITDPDGNVILLDQHV